MTLALSPNPLERTVLTGIFQAGLDAVDPQKLVKNAVIRDLLGSRQPKGVLVLGAGKAGAGMARGLVEALGGQISCRGLVLVPTGSEANFGNVEVRAVRPAASNLPTQKAFEATLELMNLAQTVNPWEQVVVLLSGGASALTPAPVAGVTLEEKIQTTTVLANAGASIHQLNGVRKHLSRFKGGGLLQAFNPNPPLFPILGYLLSDVVGDPMEVIGSGPTVADPSTFAQCIEDCQKLGVWEQLPLAVQKYLGQGNSKRETLKQTPAWAENKILGSNKIALESCAKMARSLGLETILLGSNFEGDTNALAQIHLEIFRSIRQRTFEGVPKTNTRPICLLSGGETTMRLVPHPGPGGRNQAFALELLLGLGRDEVNNLCLLSAGTDGEDGPTNSAGGWVDGLAWEKLHEWRKGHPMESQNLLATQSNNLLLGHAQALFAPGPTGTNVMDVRIGVILQESL